MSDRVLVLLNPNAGGGRSRRVWHGLQARWRGLTGLDPERLDLLAEPTASTARELLREQLSSGAYGTLVAVGGDGTAHSAINGLLEAGAGQAVDFALVPAGTGSDFARGLGLPVRGRDRAARSLARAFRAPRRAIDAISVEVDGGERRYCLNIASAGLSGAVDEVVNASAERGSYLLATVRALLHFEPRPARIWADGEPIFDGPFFLAAMANGRYFGKGMKVAPAARIDDGALDLVLVPPVPLWQMPWRLPLFLGGHHVRMRRVLVRRVREVRIEPQGDFYPYDLDGETLAPGPVTVRVLPRALRLRC